MEGMLQYFASHRPEVAFACKKTTAAEYKLGEFLLNIIYFCTGSLAVRLYGKGDHGVLPKEDVISRIQKSVLQHKDFD